MKYFETLFMGEANEFIGKLRPKTIRKIFYNIDDVFDEFLIYKNNQ